MKTETIFDNLGTFKLFKNYIATFIWSKEHSYKKILILLNCCRF